MLVAACNCDPPGQGQSHVPYIGIKFFLSERLSIQQREHPRVGQELHAARDRAELTRPEHARERYAAERLLEVGRLEPRHAEEALAARAAVEEQREAGRVRAEAGEHRLEVLARGLG